MKKRGGISITGNRARCAEPRNTPRRTFRSRPAAPEALLGRLKKELKAWNRFGFLHKRSLGLSRTGMGDEQLQKEAATLSEHETHVRECPRRAGTSSIFPATPKQPLPDALLIRSKICETTEPSNGWLNASCNRLNRRTPGCKPT